MSAEPNPAPAARRPGRGLTRRRALLGLGGGAALLLGARAALPAWLRRGPARPLSPGAQTFADAALAGLDLSRLWDVHVHLVGLGAGGTGCELDPRMQSHLHPVARLRYDAYAAAAGIRDPATADRDYLAQLVAAQRAANPAGRALVLAFDRAVREDGSEDPEHTNFHVPNEYALAAARAHAELVPCASVHPYRADAAARLETAAAGGARAVKWLPNAMGMDPSSPLCDGFYAALARLDLPLLTHAGHESAVPSAEHQELGNPLRLRRALDAGVRVVVAHCASLGSARDTDRSPPREVACLDLFLRMMGEDRYRGRLFGDLSAVTLVNRGAHVLRELLAAEELHPRLLYGSDYPVSAIAPLTSPWLLARRELLDAGDRGPLAEIDAANPLLFDLVLKRRLRLERGGRTFRFADAAFETADFFAARGA